MAKALWPGILSCVCAGASLAAAVTLVLPLPSTTAKTSLSSIFSPTPADLQSQIEHDLTGIQLAVRRVATAALNATKTVTIKAGDTLSDVLQGSGIDRSVTLDVVEAIKQVYNPRRLQSGQDLTLNFIDDPKTEDRQLDELTFELSPGESVAVARTDDGTYNARKIMAETHREMTRYDGTISSSLSAAAGEAGVPQKILNAMVNMFSFDVDFQRDIQKGDSFSVMFEQVVTKDGRVVSTEGIRVASMTLRR